MSIANRKAAYRDIHILAKKAGLTNRREYENLLFLLTGQRSCVDMRPCELEQVRSFLKDEVARPAPQGVSDEEAARILGL